MQLAVKEIIAVKNIEIQSVAMPLPMVPLWGKGQFGSYTFTNWRGFANH
jgi:hypothetical protein